MIDLGIETKIMDWLLDSDPSLEFQVRRDLLKDNSETLPQLQTKIAHEGWGKKLLEKQSDNGHWGAGFYQPKWTSTHYSLLDLKWLQVPRNISSIRTIITSLLEENKGHDGGMNPSGTIKNSDVCINGMFLDYACYFKTEEAGLQTIIDFVISQQMKDGGYNCQFNRSGATHSSMHSTCSVLEGLASYRNNGYRYRIDEVEATIDEAIEFLLVHQLYLSDRTGEIINSKFLQFSFPFRWYYNILRALLLFIELKYSPDQRINAALDQVLKKRKKSGLWNLQAFYPGELHFRMEEAGKPSKWITFFALKILKYFNQL